MYLSFVWILPFLCACKVPFHFTIIQGLPLVSSVYFIGCWEFFTVVFLTCLGFTLGEGSKHVLNFSGWWTYSRMWWKLWTPRKCTHTQYFACKFQISAEPASSFPMDALMLRLFMSVFKQLAYAPCQTGTVFNRPWDLRQNISTCWYLFFLTAANAYRSLSLKISFKNRPRKRPSFCFMKWRKCYPLNIRNWKIHISHSRLVSVWSFSETYDTD